jgi:hypothetical protein
MIRIIIMTIGRAVRDGSVRKKPATAVRRIVRVARGVAALKRPTIVAILIQIVPVVRGDAARRNNWELAGSY